MSAFPRLSLHRLLSTYDQCHGDWCAIARAVEDHYVSIIETQQRLLELPARGIGVRSTTTEGRGPEGAEPGPQDAPKTLQNRSEDAPPSEPTA